MSQYPASSANKLRTAITRSVSIARAVLLALSRDHALVDASAMAFSLFLATIPLTALAGSVVAHVLHDDSAALGLLSEMTNLAPDEVRSVIDRNIERGANQGAAPLFLFGALWLGATAFHDAMTVFERALEAERRSWIKKRLIAFGCVIALLTLLSLAGALLVAHAGGPLALIRSLLAPVRRLWPGPVTTLLGAGMTCVLVAAFFRIAVKHTSKKPRIWPGAFATTAIGAAASYGFASYARALASYAVFYGSLAAVAVVLLWLWLLCIALLVGVELNAGLERKVSASSPPATQR